MSNKSVLFGVNDISKKLMEASTKDYLLMDSYIKGEVLGKTVLPPSALANLKDDIEEVIICSYNHYADIRNFVSMMGVAQDKIKTPDYIGNLLTVKDIESVQKKGILVCSLPKSATVWLNKCLFEMQRVNHKLSRNYVYNADFNEASYFNPRLLNTMVQEGGVFVGHFQTNEFNNEVLSHYIQQGLKLIVQFRDPRQALISWVHNVDKTVADNPFMATRFNYGKRYFEKSFDGKVEFLLDAYFPKIIDWLWNWMDFYQNRGAASFLVMTQEMLSTDPQKYNCIVADYLGVPQSYLGISNKPQRDRFNFRKGKTNEWQEVLTSAAKHKINATPKFKEVLAFVESQNEWFALS